MRSGLTWKAVTTGNYGAIDLWLDGAAGRLTFKTKPVSGEVAIADLGVEPRVFAAGGLERAVKLQRLPEVMREHRMALRRTHQGARHRRHPPLRPRPAGRRPPPVVQPDLSVPLIGCAPVIPERAALGAYPGTETRVETHLGHWAPG